MARAAGASATLALALLLLGCTSIGFHNDDFRRQIDFGAHDSLALCLYLDTGISESQARALIDEAWRDEAGRYGCWEPSTTKRSPMAMPSSAGRR